MPKGNAGKSKKNNGANLGFEEKLWQAADQLRGHMDAAEYKHVVLGLIFLKYISDAFEEHRNNLDQQATDPQSEWYIKEEPLRYEFLEDRDSYTSDNIFWVPKEARWSYLQSNAKQPTIGQLIDTAMAAIEKDNASLNGVLPKDYGRPQLDKQRLGELIDLIGTIGLGDKESRSKDILGRVYEYFLGKFASAEGKGGGEFYTPQSVVQLLVEMIEPYHGRVYDPCCGSSGMFVQSEKFILAHGGRLSDISIYGQESNPTTWRLAKMNLAIRGIEANLGPHNADTFLNDLHRDLRADFILANPPFNMSIWGGERLRKDARWKFGDPPVNNANFAWVQHIISHLTPTGIAGFVLANGSMTSNQSGEGEIRKAIVDADLVDCMIALPGQLFYGTSISACLWFLARNKGNGKFRNRTGQILFIDAHKMGYLVDRTHRELSNEEIDRIAQTYHAWRGEAGLGEYRDIPGFCKSETLEKISSHHGVLTPGRYVGTGEVEESDELFSEKMSELTTKLLIQFEASTRLEKDIRDNLMELGYGE